MVVNMHAKFEVYSSNRSIPRWGNKIRKVGHVTPGGSVELSVTVLHHL